MSKNVLFEIYKVKHKIASKLMCELFQETEHPCNLWDNHTFRTNNAKIVQYGVNILFVIGGTKIWSLIQRCYRYLNKR